MVTKEELHSLLESLPDSGLEQVHSLMVVLLQEFEDLTEDDAKELREGEAEVERGEWVWWKDVQREDVGGTTGPPCGTLLPSGGS